MLRYRATTMPGRLSLIFGQARQALTPSALGLSLRLITDAEIARSCKYWPRDSENEKPVPMGPAFYFW
jgi:hypothetical protein